MAKGKAVNDGFGIEISTKKTAAVEVKALKPVTFKSRPLFIDLKSKFQIKDLGDMKSCCSRFGACGKPVPPEGPLDATYVFMGRDPGEQEVEHGRPFYPEAPGGGLFMEYLEVLGLERGDVYITNVTFCRAPKNAPPDADVIMACAALHVNEFKSLKNVKYVFPMGTTAFQLVTGVFSSVTPYIGHFLKIDLWDRKDVIVIPLHHPGYLLRKPSEREKFMEFLQGLAIK